MIALVMWCAASVAFGLLWAVCGTMVGGSAGRTRLAMEPPLFLDAD